ncbi:MAG: mannose-1-phosphate guanylyltransferase [Eubacteriaceae bacterium]
MLTALIMAGGSGKRFWPLSTEKRPKQLIKLISDKTMIRETVDRISPIIPFDKIFIATNIKQFKAIHAELPEIPEENIIIEPSFKDTAAAIGYGSIYIKKRYSESEVVVLASDHVIKDEENFRDIINIAVKEARNNKSIITLGIKPTKPEVGYGYIETQIDICIGKSCEVVAFREKPNIDIAKEYISKGNYLWNSGMFIFSINTILEEFNKYLKDHYAALMILSKYINEIQTDSINNIKKYFDQFEKISIDFGIMEKTERIKVIPVDFGWNDVGSFSALEEVFDKEGHNSLIKDIQVKEYNSNNNLYIGENSSLNIMALGLEDLIVVNNGNNLLICKKEELENIKKLI